MVIKLRIHTLFISHLLQTRSTCATAGPWWSGLGYYYINIYIKARAWTSITWKLFSNIFFFRTATDGDWPLTRTVSTPKTTTTEEDEPAFLWRRGHWKGPPAHDQRTLCQGIRIPQGERRARKMWVMSIFFISTWTESLLTSFLFWFFSKGEIWVWLRSRWLRLGLFNRFWKCRIGGWARWRAYTCGRRCDLTHTGPNQK